MRTQVPVPVQAPDQPAKVEPVAGAAVRVTDAPLLKLALQVDPQLIPAGLLVMVPAPVPARETLKTGSGTTALKVAVTDAFAVRVRLHGLVPEQAPDQPLKVNPAAGVAVSVTLVPLANDAVQVVPQLIPLGLLVTVPLPVPASVTVRTGWAATRLNVAVTDTFALKVTAHVAIPEQAPDHPAKVEPELGVGVRVTTDPVLKLALHVPPQLIPAGELVTLPAPVPARETFKTG